MDYTGEEEREEICIPLVKSERTTENVTVPLMILTFQEFFDMGNTLPSAFNGTEIPDEAECKSISFTITI